MNSIQRNMYDQGLYRPQHGKMLAGVCAGLARRFGISATMMRLIFVVSIVIPGSQVLVYLLLWLLMPKAQNHTTYPAPNAGPLQ